MRELRHPRVEEFDLPTVLAALADPIRLRTVAELAGRAELAAGECGERCAADAAKSTMSHHFRVLRDAGVTHTRIEGAHRYVTLREDDLNRRFPGLLDAILASQATPGTGTQ
ncbi:MAG: ArsR/SmtB family transcription factor [Candidatus Dormibacteria bacterium]